MTFLLVINQAWYVCIVGSESSMVTTVLLKISLGLCTVSNSLDLFEAHFSNLFGEGDEILFYIYEDTFPFKKPNNGHFIQQIVLTSSYSEIWRYRFNRHITHANIIATSYSQIYDASNQTVFYVFKNLFMVTDTMVLYIDYGSEEEFREWECQNYYRRSIFVMITDEVVRLLNLKVGVFLKCTHKMLIKSSNAFLYLM